MLKGRCEKLEFQKTLSLSYRKIETSKSKTKVLKKEPREMENKKKDKKNDPWSDHPKTQFRPIYPFFRNHKPWPTLRT